MSGISLDTIYKHAETAVTKEIDNGLIIRVFHDERVYDSDISIYIANETSSVIWKHLDGLTPIKDLVKNLSQKYNASAQRIEKDVTAMLDEFLSKNLITKIE